MAGRTISRILRNILNHFNPVHILPPYFLTVHFNIILPSTPRSSDWVPPFRHSSQNFVRISHLPRACYMHRSSDPPWFDHPNNIWFEYNLCSSSLCSFLQPTVTSSLLGPHILLSILFSNTLNLCSSLNVTDQVQHPYKTAGEVILVP
jgi:hypothetical protein